MSLRENLSHPLDWSHIQYTIFCNNGNGARLPFYLTVSLPSSTCIFSFALAVCHSRHPPNTGGRTPPPPCPLLRASTHVPTPSPHAHVSATMHPTPLVRDPTPPPHPTTTGIAFFAECLRHSAKAILHSAPDTPVVERRGSPT
jgi:hypothetical protein